MKDKLMVECVCYFKSNKSFHRILTKIKEKYISIGNFGGTIKLENITIQEKSALTDLLGQKYYLNKSDVLYINDIVKAFKNTKFENIDFYDFLCAYFGEKITIKKDIKESEKAKKEEFFNTLKNCANGKIYKFVSEAFMNKSRGSYNLLLNKYNEDGTGELLLKELIYLNEIIDIIETKSKIRVALLASEVTNNPHELDENTFLNKILTYYLCKKSGCEIPGNAEEKNALFYESNILKDDISNNTLVAGLFVCFYKLLNSNCGWNYLANIYEPFVLSLVNLNKVDVLKSLNNKVVILENPTVFMKFHELFDEEKCKITLICSNGQLNLSTLVILDMLSKTDCKFYYWGDFDPEGLLIADKLLERYKEKITPIFYTSGYYLSTMSNEIVSDKRLKQLFKIKNSKLHEISECIKMEKRAAYQESLCLNIDMISKEIEM